MNNISKQFTSLGVASLVLCGAVASANALDHVKKCGSYEGWKNYLKKNYLKMSADQDVLDIREKTSLGTVYYLQSRSNKSWTIIEKKDGSDKACVLRQGLDDKSFKTFRDFNLI